MTSTTPRNLLLILLALLISLIASNRIDAIELSQGRGERLSNNFVQPAPAATPSSSPSATFNYAASRLAADPIRPRIYAAVPEANSIVVIDTNTLTVTKTILVGSAPRALSISADRSTLWVANSGSTNSAIGVIDLDSLTVLPSLPAPAPPIDVVEGLGHRLYVNAGTFSYSIMQIDSDTGQYLGNFGYPDVYGGFLAVTPDRNTLVYGTGGSSPSTLDKFDISSPTAALLQSTRSVGSNGESLRLSHSGDWLVYPNGSGNAGPYNTFEIPTANITAVNCTFIIGDDYPGPATFSNDDTLLFHSSFGLANRIRTFETCFGTFLGSFDLSTNNNVSDLVVDASGQWLFVSTRGFGSPAPGDIRVFSTNRVDPVRPFAKSIVSRKTHGPAGTFDINLPKTCTYGIEYRSEAPLGTHHIVFSFAGPVTIAGATVTPEPGGTAELDGDPVVSADSTEVTVNLKNVSNAQVINVVLNGVNDGTSIGDVAVMMGFLLGDVNANGRVDGNDVSAVQAATRQNVTSANFQYDVNASGRIDGNDVSMAQAQTRTILH